MKVLISVLLIFGTYISSLAQKKFEYGIKGGLSIVDLREESVPSFLPKIDYRFSYHLGGFAEYLLRDKIALHGEMLFSSQGGSSDVVYIGDSGEVISTERPKYVYNYINIPVLFKYTLVKGLNLKSGPQMGVLLSATFDNPNFGEENVKDSLSLLDFSWSFGTGYEFGSGVLVDLTYNLGLSNTIDAENSNFKRKNSVLQLSLGYKF